MTSFVNNKILHIDTYVYCRYKCPECGKQNWVDHGDQNDETNADCEGVCCWGCGYEGIIEDMRNYLSALSHSEDEKAMLEIASVHYGMDKLPQYVIQQVKELDE